MKPKIRFSANEIKMTQTKWPVIVLLITGLLLSVLSLLMIAEIIYSILIVEKLLFGLGIILFSCGLLFLFKLHSMIISLNSSRGIIEIKNIYTTKKIATAFPISHFSRLIVFERLINQAKDKISRTYEIFLDSDAETALLLAEFQEKEAAFEFVQKFQELILLDIYYMEKIYRKSEFKLKASNIPVSIQSSDITMLKKIQKESEIVFKWKTGYPGLSLLFLTGILFGMYYILNFCIMQETGFIPVNIGEYIILGVLLLFMLIFYTFYYHRTKTIRLGRESIAYYRNIMGIKTGRVEMNWDDVLRVWNTISTPWLYVISKTGYELFQEIIELSLKKQTPQLQKDISARASDFAKQQLAINVDSLPVSDRIRIEQEIINFML